MKYRKKPVVIEAMQLTSDNYMEVKGWINGDDGRGSAHPAYLGSGAISIGIRTLEGDMRADLGDWVIKGAKGEFYPCKPDIFAATYEPAE
jgi:hypothetical protein